MLRCRSEDLRLAVSGNSEEKIMPKIEQHGREKHNLTMDGETKNRVRSAIQRKAA
jgi:predicted small metal-binding protein